MRFVNLLTVIVVLATGATVLADEPMSKSEAEARASLALAKAKAARTPTFAAKTQAVSYEVAKMISLKEGKPIFVSIKLKCDDLCKQLRPEFIICHEESLENNATPRAVLLLPDNSGNLWRVKTWTESPSALQVRQAAADSKKTIAEPADGSLDVLMASFVAGLVAVEPNAEYGQVSPFRQCGPNGCVDVVPSDATLRAWGYTPMPSGSATGTHDSFAATVGDFVARFPRLSRFRGRVRGAMGLPPPQIAGGFVSFPSQAMQVQATQQAAPASASARPTAVAGPASEFVQIGPHRVPGKLIDRARAAGLSWPTIFKILLTAGIEALQRLLDELGK
jgi:hypothetical protein